MLAVVGQPGDGPEVFVLLPVDGRWQGRVLELVGLEPCAKSAHLFAVDVAGGVEDGSGSLVLGVRPRVLQLLAHLYPVGLRVAGLQEGQRVAGVMVPAELLGYLRPPLRHRAEGVGGVVCLPVQLGRDVVDGAFHEPSHGVGEYAVVLPVATLGYGIHSVRCCHVGVGASRSRRGDAELDGGVCLLYHVVHVCHHLVDVGAPPVAE